MYIICIERERVLCAEPANKMVSTHTTIPDHLQLQESMVSMYEHSLTTIGMPLAVNMIVILVHMC